MKIIKILVVEPNKEPYVAEVKDNISSLYGYVYFPFEFIEIEEGITLVASFQFNSTLKSNRIFKNDIIYGNFVILAQKGKSFLSLSDEKIKEYTNIFQIENNFKIKS